MGTSDDSPYREASPSRPPARRHRPAKSASKSAPQHRPPKSHDRQHPAAQSSTAKSTSSRSTASKSTSTKSTATKSTATKSNGRRRRRGKGGVSPANEFTSHPTSRNAQVTTRAWLLDEYGPHCAYCGSKFSTRLMTLDHVAPRRGQTAYDRRDNLVLCCRGCNAAKRDMAPLAFLLAVKARAANLVRFGAHLSEGLLALARPLVRGKDPNAETVQRERVTWGPADEGESPYKD